MAAAPAPAVDPLKPGDDWSEVRSGSLVVYSSASRGDTKSITERVRDFRADVFGAGRPFRASPPEPITLFLFEDREFFDLYDPHGNGAFFQPGDAVDYLLLAREQWEDTLPLALSMQARHVLGEVSSEMPAWMRRGLAGFYSTYRSRGDHAKVGHRVDGKFDVLRNGAVIPWDRVLEIVDSSPELGAPDRVEIFDAQSWVMVHYMVTETEAGEGGLAQYLAHLGAGTGAATAFRDVFGFERAELPERAARYSRGLGFDPIEFRRPASEANAARRLDVVRGQLPRARLLAELGEMAASLPSHGSRDRGRLAKDQVNAALEMDPHLAAGHRGLGQVHLTEDDASGALLHLRRAVREGPSDVRAHYLLARALLTPYEERRVRFSLRKKEPPAPIAEARRELMTCLSLNPGFGEAHVLLGRSYLHDPGDPSPGIRTLQSVLPLYRGRADVLHSLVLLLLRAGQVDAAFPLLDGSGATDPPRQKIRATVTGEALRLAAQARERGDTRGALKLLSGVRDRSFSWGLDAEQTAALAAFEGLEGEAHTAVDLSPDEADRQYSRYMKALELSSARKYKKAIAILDDLLSRPNDETLRGNIVTLHEQARYNRALSLFERGRHEQALEIARAVKKETSSPELRNMAKALAQNCKRALDN